MISVIKITNTKNFSCGTRDKNGFTLRKAEILRKAIINAENSNKSFNNGVDAIEEALKDRRSSYL